MAKKATDVSEFFTNKETTTKKRKATDVSEYFVTEKDLKTFYDSFQARVDYWAEERDNFFKKTNDYYTNRDPSYYGLDDSTKWKASATKKQSWLQEEAEYLGSILDTYGYYFDSKTADSLRKAFSETNTAGSKVLKQADDDIGFWNQFKDENQYHDYYFGSKYRDMSYSDVMKARESATGKEKDWLMQNYMTSAEAQAEIDRLEEEMKQKDKDKSAWDHVTDFVSSFFTDAETGEGNDTQKYLDRIAQLKGVRDTAQRIEKVESYVPYRSDSRFSEASANGASIANPTVEEMNEYEYLLEKAYSSIDRTAPDGGMVAEAEVARLEQNPVKVKNKVHFYIDNPELRGYPVPWGATDEDWESIMHRGLQYNWDELTEDEIQMYDYLLAEKGEEAADQYLEDIQVVLDKRATDAMNTHVQKQIDEGGVLTNIGLSLASIPTNIVGGALAFADNTINQLKGESINPYSPAQSFRNFATTVRGEVGAEIADKATWELFGQNVMQNVYNAGLSMGDSLLGAAMMGSAYSLVAGSGAAANQAANLYEKGASNEQIFWGGLTAGVAEAVFEKVSLDKLLSAKTIENPLQLVTEVLKQAGVEASEEVFTEIANIISDGIVMGSQSDLSLAIKMYEDGYFDENGIHHEPLSHADAVKKALIDKTCEVAWAGISGFLSGGGSSFIVSGTQYIKQSNAQTNLGRDIVKQNGYDALKNLATDASSVGLVKGEANVKNLTQKTQTGVDAIKEGNASKRQANKTYRQVGRLSQAVDSVRNEQNIAEIRTSLESKGLSKSEAKKAATLLNEALYSDGAYSKELYKSVMNDEGVWDTLRELVSSPDSTLKNRNLQHKLGRMGLKVNENGTIVSSVETGETESHYVDESLSFIEDASKREYEASVEGKSINKSTGEAIDIVEVASIKNGQMMLKVKSAGGAELVVNAKDVSYANEGEALVYEAVANMGLNAVSANSILKLYTPSQDASTFARGVQEAYRYGLYNYSELDMYQDGNFLLDLTDEQVKRAYKLGQIQSGSDTAVAVAKLKEAIANSKGKKGEGKVHFEGDAKGINVDNLKDQQKVSIKTMEMLSKALGIEFYVYASYENQHGVRVYKTNDGKVRPAPNGVYDKATGAIHIDLNAGESGEGTMLFTIAHELTHFIKAWSPAKFKVLANFLVEQYGKKGMSVEQLVRRQMANMKANGRKNVTYDKAFEEFVADSMQTMLTSGNVMESLAEIKRRDEGLWNKIKEFFAGLVEHLKKVVSTYSNFAPDTVEGQTVAEMTDVIEQLEKLFTEGLVDASENFRAISSTEQQKLAEVGIGFDEDTRSVHSLRFSTGRKDALGNVIDLVKVGKKEFNTEAIAQLVAKGTGRSIEDARKWVNSEIAIANIVMNHPEFLDFQADDRYESIKKNSDYPQGTVDLSNLCPKRTEFTAMFDMLQKKYPNKLFTASDVAAMRSILKERGITVACGACFVEDRRQLLGEIADTYIGMWREAVETGKPLQKTNASGNKVTLTVTKALAKQYGLKQGSEILATDKYIPTQYDLTTYEGFKLLEKNHPTIAMGFNRYNNSRGQQAGRLIEGRAEYNRQILGWSDAKVRSVNNNGGLRIFSFSDFEVVHLLDLVQVILDCSAKGVKIQGYTKIPAFARLVRETGIKINRSLIPKGQTGLKTVNGKQVLDYDTTEGIDINDENFIDERDNPNVGNILIGINPTQIGIAMLDDFVDYIIPFHTNKSKDICKALGLAEWVNYKEFQHEKDIDTDKASKHNVNIYTEVIGKYHPTNKVEFVDAFLKVCKEQKKIPRYSEFLNKEYKADGAYSDEYGSYDFTYREGYHKLLVDFKMFDHNGNILPQGEITPNLDDAFMAELLKGEVDKKQNYEFPQEVYDRLDKEFGEEDVLLSARYKKANVNTELLSLVERVEQGGLPNERVYFGVVSKTNAEQIYRLTGIRVDGYKVAIEARQIKHILNDHGKNGLADNSMADNSDIAKMEFTLDSPDDISAAGKTQAYTHMVNGRNRTADTVLYEKNIGEKSYYVVQAVPDTKAKTLFIVSAFIGKKGYKKEASQLINAKSLDATAKTGSANASVGIIPQPSDSVKDFDENPHSDRNKDSVSNRALLANALESAVQNEFEKKTLAEYKEELDRADALEKELAEIRAKKRELSFAKGHKDTEALNKLRDQEIKTINRIDVRDKKLLRLEATKPLKDIIHREREKAYKRAEKEGKEALAKYREKTAQTQRELLNRWKESRKEAVENRHKSEVRTKIKNFKKKLESMLQHPTDRQYVPMGLANAMIEVCELINTDTSLYHKDGSINKAQERRNLTKEKLNDLKNEYENLKTNVDPMYSGEFDETVYAYLKELQENFGGKNLSEMTLDELREMYETLRAIEETLRDARKLIGWGDAADVYEAGDAIASEQAEITKKRKNGKRNSADKTRDKTLNYTLSPMRNVERMSAYNEDSFFVKLFKKLEQGIRKKNKFVMESYKLFEPLTTGENAKTYEDAIYNEYGGKKYTDINGRTFGISKMQMMQTILSYEREVANGMHHIEGSGFSFADLDMLRKGKLKDAVSEEYSHRVPSAVAMVEGFKEALQGDKWAQDYMAEARKFFNEKAKDAINETMLAIKHRIIAKDKNYIPFEVDKNFVVREISAGNDIQQTINSYGMLKETKVGASQPLIITGLNNILDRHIDQVGNVHGLAVDIRNFNKVWNVRTMDSVGSDPTVKTAVQRNWGVEGVAHIEQAVQDIQGARPNNQSALYRKIKSNYIGATFLLNLSVVTKQVGSLFTATSMLRYRSPIRMMGNLVYTMANHKKISAEVDKYTATAWMRRQGLSDAELQTLLTEGKKSLIGKLLGKLPAAINPTKWIQGMDSAVALSLWKYAKQDTAKRTGLTGEELLKATAEFYDEVIENTQSMTDVLHRPEVQKKGDLISETLGMFKTDLYQMAGQLQVTAGRFTANKSKENGKALVRTASSILSSAVWAQLMTTLFALLRYKVDPYREEEDEELTAESWLKRQSFALTGDFVGYIFPLLGSETVGLIENIVYGESEDAVDNIVLTAINDVFDTMTTIASSVKDGEMPSAADSQKLVTKALQMFGIPANNISRFVNAVQLHAKDIANGEFLSFEAGVERNSKHHAHRIVEAMSSGKTDVAMGLFEEAVEELALRKAKDGEITEDELKDAKSDLKTALGNKYKDGDVDFETVTEILSELFGMSEDDIYWQFDQWDYAVENGSSDGYAKYDDFLVAVETGKNLKAVVQVYLDNGVEAKTLASQITSHYKPLYKEMTNAERASIKGYLLNAYVLLGYKRSDKNKDINDWLKD